MTLDIGDLIEIESDFHSDVGEVYEIIWIEIFEESTGIRLTLKDRSGNIEIRTVPSHWIRKV